MGDKEFLAYHQGSKVMKYNREAIVEKNITISFEFERYVVEHPEILEQIPDGAAVFFLPKDDPELYRVSLDTARKAQAEGKASSAIFLKVEALAPARPRLGLRPFGFLCVNYGT
jgi:hypothetical protein